MKLKRLVALSISMIMLLSSNSFAEVPPQNEIIDLSSNSANAQVNTNNNEAWSLEAQMLITSGVHNQGERVINPAAYIGGYDNNFYDINHFKTLRKFSEPKDDWSALIMAFTGGAMVIKSWAHIHNTYTDMADQYELISPATENGCQSTVEMSVITLDAGLLSDEDTASADFPTSEAEIDKWIANNAAEADGSLIYTRYNVNGTKWYIMTSYDQMKQADDGMTAPLETVALRFLSNEKVLAITLKSQDSVTSQRSLGARYTESMQDIDYIVATFK